MKTHSRRAHDRAACLHFGRAALASAGLAIVATASAGTTGTAGGSGGTDFNLSCGLSKVLVGIEGKAGAFVDSVQGVCVQINDDGSWQGSTTATARAGGSGGTAFHLTCPSGHAVTGIKGRAASYIDRLEVQCARLGRLAKPVITTTYFLAGVAGGTGGSVFGPLICPDNDAPALAIRGRASTWVDSIRLECGRPWTLGFASARITISPNPTRVGQTTSATVAMNMNPAADATVTFASSNTNVATAGTATVAPTVRDAYRSLQIVAAGCTNITGSYKGSEAHTENHRDLLVHGAASPYLSLTTPTTLRTGAAAAVTVTIPSPAPKGGKIVSLVVLEKGTLVAPASVTIPEGLVAAGVEVTAGSAPGCARLQAKGNNAVVTHAIGVVQ